MTEPTSNKLGTALRSQRRSRRLTLRDLSDEIGVSFNTLSRVERGQLPDLKNFNRIIDWLGMPADAFADDGATTTDAIARHLRSDQRLSDDAATRIASMVEEMYEQLVREQPALAVHLRAAKTFKPAASTLLADILNDLQNALLAE